MASHAKRPQARDGADIERVASFAPGKGVTLGMCPRLLAAADKFVAENSGFESSTVGDMVRGELGMAPDINQAAMVPLRHKVFGFDAALKWSFFLFTASRRIVADDADRIPPEFQDPAEWPRFDPGRYYEEIAQVYDLAVDSAVWDLCEADDEDDSASGDE